MDVNAIGNIPQDLMWWILDVNQIGDLPHDLIGRIWDVNLIKNVQNNLISWIWDVIQMQTPESNVLRSFLKRSGTRGLFAKFYNPGVSSDVYMLIKTRAPTQVTPTDV